MELPLYLKGGYNGYMKNDGDLCIHQTRQRIIEIPIDDFLNDIKVTFCD